MYVLTLHSIHVKNKEIAHFMCNFFAFKIKSTFIYFISMLLLVVIKTI